MGNDTRSRAQWREAFEQCQAHARKLRREVASREAKAWSEGYDAGVTATEALGPDTSNPYASPIRDAAGSEDDRG